MKAVTFELDKDELPVRSSQPEPSLTHTDTPIVAAATDAHPGRLLEPSHSQELNRDRCQPTRKRQERGGGQAKVDSTTAGVCRHEGDAGQQYDGMTRYGAYCRSATAAAGTRDYTFDQCAAKACEVSHPKRPILAIEYLTSGIGPGGNCFLMGATMQAPIQPCPTGFLACNPSSNANCANAVPWEGSMWSASNSDGSPDFGAAGGRNLYSGRGTVIGVTCTLMY